MKLHRIMFAAVLASLASCSNAPTTPSDRAATSITGARRTAEPVGGAAFGSGTISIDPVMESAVTDSTETSITRGGNMFGSGT